MKKKDTYHLIDFIYIIVKLLISTALQVVTPVLSVLIIIYLYKDFRFSSGTMKYIDVVPYYGERLDLYLTNLGLPEPWNLIVGILEVLFFLVLIVVVYVGVPLIIFSIGLVLSRTFSIVRINTKNSLFYALETKRGKPHKERLSGSEYFELKETRKAEKEKVKNEKAVDKILKKNYKSMPNITKNNYTDYTKDVFSDSGYNAKTDYEPEAETAMEVPDDVRAALEFYGFRNFNYTEKELKKVRTKLLIKYHPDNNPDEDTSEKTQLVNSYFSILTELKK
jgi:hypothetical protein